MPPTTELDTIVETSLRSFYRNEICKGWWGRENEAVNLYAWGHLAREVRNKGPLRDLTQIGIEVAVRQKELARYPGKERNVRKDLVIWPAARMNYWKDHLPYNEPLAIMEWKVNYRLDRRGHAKNQGDHKKDIQWLKDAFFLPRMTTFTGYAVLLELTKDPRELHCVKVHAGVVNEDFLNEPKRETRAQSTTQSKLI